MRGTENFEQEVKEYLSKHRCVSKKDLKDYLYKTHPKDQYTGYSYRNMDTKLKKMGEQNIISILKNKGDKTKFGINDANNKTSYVTLYEDTIYSEHFERLIDQLNEDKPDLKYVIEEIYDYHKNGPLTQHELDQLIKAFSKVFNVLDTESTDKMLQLLEYSIIGKGLKCKHGFVLEEILVTLLKKYSCKKSKYPDLRKNILSLMGHYNLDKLIIERLKKDALYLEKPTYVEEDYKTDSLSKAIVSNLKELTDLKLTLKKDGKTESARLVNNVIYYFKKPDLESINKNYGLK